MKVKIKPARLPKDARITLRINKELKKALTDKKISVQAELDKAMEKFIEIYLDIRIKRND